MLQANVPVTLNRHRIQTKIRHVSGDIVDLTIEPNNAQVDANGVVRAFTVELRPGEYAGYLLHPIRSKTHKNILWAVDFFTSLGLSILGNMIIKASPASSATKQNMVQLSRFFLFSNPGGQQIRSFVAEHFLPENLGYHDFMTDELAGYGQIRIKT